MMVMTHCQDHILTENIWFVWSKTSYSGDKWKCYYAGRRDKNIHKRRTFITICKEILTIQKKLANVNLVILVNLVNLVNLVILAIVVNLGILVNLTILVILMNLMNLVNLVILMILMNLVYLAILVILVYLAILVILCETMIFGILESPSFQKYSIYWVFCAYHMIV